MPDLAEPLPASTDQGQRTRDKDLRLPALVAATVAILLYAISLNGTYVFDDVHLIQLDDRAADPSQWGRYLWGSEGYNDGIDALYRPITSLSYAMQAWGHGTGENVAWAYHLVNVLLYAGVCALVTLWAGRVARESAFGSRPSTSPWTVAMAAGLVFAALPVHVEVVAGIVGRAELICALGFFGGLVLVTRPLSPARIVGFIGCLLLSIGAKEQGLLLPAVVLVWYGVHRWHGRERLSSMTNGYGRALLLATILPMAGYLFWREHILPMAWPRELLDPTIQPMREVTGLDRWLMPVALAGRALHLLVWPDRLALDYGTAVIAPPQRWDDPHLWLGFLAIAIYLAALGHALLRRWAAGVVILAGFAFTYGMVSNFATIIGTIFGERLLFLPSAFFVTYLVLLAVRLRVSPRALVAGATALALLGAGRSLLYLRHWDDRATLYTQQSQVQPQSVRIWMLLGEELRQRGQLERAAEAAENATQLAPDYWDAWLLRSDVALTRGRLDEALEYADRAVAARHSVKTVNRREAVAKLIREREAGAEE